MVNHVAVERSKAGRFEDFDIPAAGEGAERAGWKIGPSGFPAALEQKFSLLAASPEVPGFRSGPGFAAFELYRAPFLERTVENIFV